MRITGNTPVGSKPGASGVKAKGSSGNAFASHLSDETAVKNAESAPPLASVGAMLALQEMDDALGARKKAIRQGDLLLDKLEAIRRDLLLGGVPQDRLHNLKTLVKQQRVAVIDPLLNDILDDIDLRVRVELAKFGQY